jgi:hypothetical protein
VCGEGVAKGVAARLLADSRAEDGLAHRALYDGLVQMVAASLPRLRVPVAARRREDPLPRCASAGGGILCRECMGQLDLACASFEVA